MEPVLVFPPLILTTHCFQSSADMLLLSPLSAWPSRLGCASSWPGGGGGEVALSPTGQGAPMGARPEPRLLTCPSVAGEG